MVQKAAEMVGKRFGRLTVIERSENYHFMTGYGSYGSKPVWRCICDCGNETYVVGSNLRQGYTKSCGCLQKERVAESNKRRRKHEHSLRKDGDIHNLT